MGGYQAFSDNGQVRKRMLSQSDNNTKNRSACKEPDRSDPYFSYTKRIVYNT